MLKIPNFTAGLFEDIDVSFIIMRCVQICTKKEGKEGKFTDSRITGSLAHRSMAVKPEGEGLQSMGGLIPKENIEEGDDTTKIQVKLFLIFKKFTLYLFILQCLPLYSILLALDNPTVHHFSLDIEGAELPVLKTVPWDKVDIRFSY